MEVHVSRTSWVRSRGVPVFSVNDGNTCKWKEYGRNQCGPVFNDGSKWDKYGKHFEVSQYLV